jgi:hypothetical protein
MKSEMFADLQTVVFRNGTPRVIKFRLDAGWLERLQQYAESAAQKLVQER